MPALRTGGNNLDEAYIMERERYDRPDVAHLLWHCGEALAWPQLVRHFGTDWRGLLAQLILFGFIYPAKEGLVPAEIIQELLESLRREKSTPNDRALCRRHAPFPRAIAY